MFKELITKLAKIFNKNLTPYMIIGGQAVILYGEPRLTRDIDITLGIGTEKLDNILNIVKELNLKILAEDIPSFVKKTMVLPVMDEPTGIRIDFIFSFTPYEKQAIQRGKKVLLDNVEVNFASVEDLIIHKIFANRARDLEDVKNIILKNSDIDEIYIKKWLREFDTALQESSFISVFENILKDFKI
ncbi:MAG: nucleotidyl transferase AbiEii/AbiGii toxin family protein [Armatimonadota bacterium]